MADHDDSPPDTRQTEPPPETPADKHPAEQRIAWVLVVMVFLAVFIWPVVGYEVPAGTVAALITAITTLVVARKATS